MPVPTRTGHENAGGITGTALRRLRSWPAGINSPFVSYGPAIRSASAGQPAFHPPRRSSNHYVQHRALRESFSIQSSCLPDLHDAHRHPFGPPFGEGERKQFGRTNGWRKNDDPPVETDRRAIAGRGKAHPTIAEKRPRASCPSGAGLHDLVQGHRLQWLRPCCHRGAGCRDHHRRAGPSQTPCGVETRPCQPPPGGVD